ncbi:hypothetical protein DFH06DRAFT_1326718 [Mycena polygramma]|nr:hypothetical protein DFH06DRAFT_1326718 [Mycena polygramma]
MSLATMNSITFDVLMIILLRAYYAHRYDWRFSVDFRTLLCLVCRDWRMTIYSTALFWSSLPITLATTVAYTQFHLKRSTHANLSVLLHLIPFNLPSRLLQLPVNLRQRPLLPVLTTTVAALGPAAHRIQRLTVQARTPREWQLAALILSPVRLEGLRALSVMVQTTRRHVAEPRAAPCAGITLSLPTASLTEIRLSGASCVALPPLVSGQLTVLPLIWLRGSHSVWWADLAALLRATVSLRLLQVAHVDIVEAEVRTTLALPQLSTLEVTYMDVATILPISHVSMPAVVVLRVNAICGGIDSFARHFRALLPGVQDVALYMRDFNPDEVFRFLAIMPGLRTLYTSHMQPKTTELLLRMLGSGLVMSALWELIVGHPFTADDRQSLARAYASGGISTGSTVRARSRLVHGASEIFTVSGRGVEVRKTTLEFEGGNIAEEWAANEHKVLM